MRWLRSDWAPPLMLGVLLGLGIAGSSASAGDWQQSSDIKTQRKDYARHIPNELVYVKDLRTGLCFAVLPEYSTGVSASTTLFTIVPCDNVSHVLVNSLESCEGKGCQ